MFWCRQIGGIQGEKIGQIGGLQGEKIGQIGGLQIEKSDVLVGQIGGLQGEKCINQEVELWNFYQKLFVKSCNPVSSRKKTCL